MIINDYETLKQVLSLYANVENILDTDYINPSTIHYCLCELERKHEDDHYYYYGMVSDKPITIKSKEGKVWNIPANMLLSKTNIFSTISTDTLKDYKGRAKTLLKAPKALIEGLNNYFNKFFNGTQDIKEDKWVL